MSIRQDWTVSGIGGTVCALAAMFSGALAAPQEFTRVDSILITEFTGRIVVDVRDGADYKQGHIADSLHIPFARLKAREDELKAYRDRPIVIICKMGQQSGAAAKQLRSAGFQKVYKMAGGMLEWRNLQLPGVR